MKIAAVITVDPPPDRSGRAVRLQDELFDRLGTHLHSVRLVAPRLFDHACRAAIDEAPDVLVAFCDGRLARRVGQIGYDNNIPIGLVCEAVRPVWASRLCCGVSKEAILGDLSRGTVATSRLDVGAVGGQVFFNRALCGAVAHLAEMDSGMAPPGMAGLLRLELLAALATHPNVRIQATGHDIASACALSIAVDAVDADGLGAVGRGLRALHCLAYAPPGGFARVRSAWNALRHRAWRRSRYAVYFEVAQAIVDAGQSVWISLDGEPIRFSGATRVRIVPRAIEAIGIPPARGEAAPSIAEPWLSRVWNPSEPFGTRSR